MQLLPAACWFSFTCFCLQEVLHRLPHTETSPLSPLPSWRDGSLRWLKHCSWPASGRISINVGMSCLGGGMPALALATLRV